MRPVMSCPASRDDVRARTLAAALALAHGHDRLLPSKLPHADMMLPAPTDRIGSDHDRGPHAQLQQHAAEAPAPASKAAMVPAGPASAPQPADCPASTARQHASAPASGGPSTAGSPSSRSRAASYGAAGPVGRSRRLLPSSFATSGTAGTRTDQPPMQQSQGDGAWRKHHTVFTNAKAGMDKVDHDHVQRVVYEMSKARFLCSSYSGCYPGLRPCHCARWHAAVALSCCHAVQRC